MANFKFDVDADGIALITWDMPGKTMNVIDFGLVDELEQHVEKVASDPAIKGAVVASGKDTFGAGADLTMLEKQRQDYETTLKTKGEEAAVTMVFERSRKLSQVSSLRKTWLSLRERSNTIVTAASSPFCLSSVS